MVVVVVVVAAVAVVGAPPAYQPPLLPTLLRARSFCSRSSSHTTSSCLKIHSRDFDKFGFGFFFWGGGGGEAWGG